MLLVLALILNIKAIINSIKYYYFQNSQYLFNYHFMTAITFIGNLAILTGFSCFGVSLYFHKKEAYFQKLFNSLEKSPKYHLDYVEKVDQLPVDKNVLLFGTARTLTD